MRRMVLGMTAALGACASPKEADVKWPTLDGKPPLIIAHRGASGYLPEHTIEAYALAIEQGADVIEPDLVFTKDGVLVARHDRYLSTTTNVTDKPEFAGRKRANTDPRTEPREDWWVEDFTLAELKTLRARQPFPGRSKAHDDKFEIPTFAEMLSLVAAKAKEAGRPVGVYPETKHPTFFASIGHDFERPLLAALADFDAGPVFIQSFEPEILKRLKGKTNAKLVQLVYEKDPGAGPNILLEEIATYADGVGAAKELVLSESGIASTFIGDSHALGLPVHIWTFRNDRPSIGIEALKGDEGLRLSDLARGIEEALQPNEAYVTIASVEIDWTHFAVIQSAGEELNYFVRRGADGVFADFPETAVKVRSAVSPSFEKR